MHPVKKQLIKRYGKYCMICGQYVRKGITYHHIKPKSLGGEYTISNGSLLCDCCHRHLHTYQYGTKEYQKLTRIIKNYKKYH